MNVAMVSEYLHVAKSTIYKWVEQNYIGNEGADEISEFPLAVC
jgi:hypothetical protein